MNAPKKLSTSLLTLFLVPLLLLAAGCSSDDNPTNPAPEDDWTPEITHYEVSVKMSSIFAVEDCETAPGNPGDFRYTLQITRKDEFDNTITIGTIGPHGLTVGDDSSAGASTDPIRFLMPNEPGATFEVEYWVGEYDPAPDFEVHGWQYHTLDRTEEQLWAAGTRAYHAYRDEDPENSYGVLKFAVWNTGDNCSGYANYIVTWKPVYEEAASR